MLLLIYSLLSNYCVKIKYNMPVRKLIVWRFLLLLLLLLLFFLLVSITVVNFQPYNLRSTQKRKSRNCYLHNFSENGSPEAFNPTVCLKRLKFLERDDIQSSRFYLEKGKITVKQDKPILTNKKHLIKLCSIVLPVILLVYFRGFVYNNGIYLAKKYPEITPSWQTFYSIAVNLQKNIKQKFMYNQQEPVGGDKKPNMKFPEVNSTLLQENSEIRQLVRNYLIEIKKKNKNKNAIKSAQNFVQEQCKKDMRVHSFSRNNKSEKKNNATLYDLESLIDYALESQGAKILTVFNTKQYGVIRVKYFDINLWQELSSFLMKYFKCFSLNGPNSILIPWKKPGDCWAFKGSYGRAQIKLSQEIFISAVTMEHIPKEFIPEKNMQSAPKKFSIFGVEEHGSEINRIHLGSFEYDVAGPAAQTFFVAFKLSICFHTVELVIESNHGNEIFTCVYKIRIHGHR